jgi:hypothetical protein
MIPMRHDPRRIVPTVVLPQPRHSQTEVWVEPRDPDGEDLMWPERFGEFEVSKLERALGPIMAAGRLQQSPTAKGGNIILADYWKLWDGETASRYGLQWDGERREFPKMEMVVASHFNALTIWGLWLDRVRNRRAMLMFAWSGRKPLNGREAYGHARRRARHGKPMVSFFLKL